MPPKDDQPRGYLDGKDKDDCDRYVKEVVYNVLENRTFDQRDEQMIKDAIGESIDLRLSNHAAVCSENRKKDNHFSVTTIIAVVASVISLGMFIMMLIKILPLLKNLPIE